MSDQLIQEHYFGYKTEGVALDNIVPKTPLEEGQITWFKVPWGFWDVARTGTFGEALFRLSW